ncbi:MAG: DNA methyltransferase [Rhodobacteraceae bacterium]|nr:DNA methyltransferase [Paracoccaceae bacterium]
MVKSLFDSDTPASMKKPPLKQKSKLGKWGWYETRDGLIFPSWCEAKKKIPIGREYQFKNKKTGETKTFMVHPMCGDVEKHKLPPILDPMCGAGSTCLVALSLGRRFIGIDLNPWAIECTWHRCMELIENRDDDPMKNPDGTDHQIRIKIVKKAPYYIDLKKDSWLILGDGIEVMKNMSDGIMDLIYNNPPYFSNKNYNATKPFYDWIDTQRKKRGCPELGQDQFTLMGERLDNA